MRIAIVSDAWKPQVNGVVRTLDTVRREVSALGHEVEMIGPDRFRTIPCPTYPEIPLAILPGRRMRRLLEGFRPDAIHIATEGPLGMAARRYCLRRGLPFTTAYHTRFPEYIRARFRFPVSWSYAILRRFHRPSRGVMVATRSIRRELEARGFRNIRDWSRGVDLALFRPRDVPPLEGERPILLFVGRVAVEKNIAAFLELDVPGTKYVVGDGPQRASLAQRYPAARFLGARFGEALAATYAAADVFVFPSRTDTFGLVMLEAMACGLPVAAYPVPGPLDVVADERVGALDPDLATAVRLAQTRSRADCRAHAEQFSWSNCARQFLGNLAPFGGTDAPPQPAPEARPSLQST